MQLIKSIKTTTGLIKEIEYNQGADEIVFNQYIIEHDSSRGKEYKLKCDSITFKTSELAEIYDIIC